MIRFEKQIVGPHKEKIIARFEIIEEGTIEFPPKDEFGHDLRDTSPEEANFVREDLKDQLVKRINAKILQYVYEHLRNPQRLVITEDIKDRLLLIHPSIHKKLEAGEICLHDLFGLPKVMKHERSVRDEKKSTPSAASVQSRKGEL